MYVVSTVSGKKKKKNQNVSPPSGEKGEEKPTLVAF
jgi:hypothetical protein